MLKIKSLVHLKMSVGLSNPNRNKDCLLQNLWITEKTSGICIFEENFDKHSRFKFSNDLICGFFSAISMLALDVFTEDISYIKLSNSKIFFKNSKNFLFIFRFQNQFDYTPHKIKSLVNRISKIFVEIYDITFQNWNRDLYHFKYFSNHLKNILC